jgi:hypothetical protein
MADQPDNEPYLVESTATAREQLRAIMRRAIRSDESDALLAAVRRIQARLTADARAVGDPIFRFRRINMDVLHFVDFPLYVQYGIPDGRRVAIIRRFLRMSGTPS